MNKEVLTTRKYKLIQEIINLEDEAEISKLEAQLALLHQKEKFWSAIKPIRKAVSLEDMIAEQGYKPLQKKDFFQKTKKLDIEESLEDLLLMLD